jgi:hypothetical protein
MSKHAAARFKNVLFALFTKRTFWLMKAIAGNVPKRPPTFKRTTISNAIPILQDIATECLVHDLAKKEFNLIVRDKKSWHVTRNKGWGWREKKQSFNKWFIKNIYYKNCIYVFWSNKKCIYVGRTIRGKGRPQSHFDKSWFTPVTRIVIFSTTAPTNVPKLECLAIHRFKPKENGIRASIPKWAKRCPLCEIHLLISNELRAIFAFKH